MSENKINTTIRKKYIIKIFCEYYSPPQMKERYEHFCKTSELDFYGPEDDKTVYIVGDEDSPKYTHAIIIGNITPQLSIPKENVIGLSYEPNSPESQWFFTATKELIEYAKNNINKYYVGDLRGLPQPPFLEGCGFMWYQHPKKVVTVKANIMSFVISYKFLSVNHHYRHRLINYILTNNIPIDIYGSGCHLYYHLDPERKRIKGPFPMDHWAVPYEDHMFTISIENVCSNYYFSEKIITPLLSRCTPLYFGCKNIETWVGNDSIIRLTGEITKDMNIICDVLKSPDQYYKTPDIQKIEDNVNVLKHLDEIFDPEVTITSTHNVN